MKAIISFEPNNKGIDSVKKLGKSPIKKWSDFKSVSLRTFNLQLK